VGVPTTKGRGVAAIVAAGACALSAAVLPAPVGASVPQVPQVVEDCFGDPIRLGVAIYVPANSTGWTHGTPGDDVIMGTDGDDRIDGDGGDDTICGKGGDDSLFGDFGNDQIDGAGGADVIFGNEANDRIFAGRGADTVDAGPDDDAVWGGDGEDHLYGGEDDDVLYGQDDDDAVECGEDTDSDADDDFAMGNEGSDWHSGCETWWTDDFPGPE
jgi:Ca2+-binding RTX toxin-like protein